VVRGFAYYTGMVFEVFDTIPTTTARLWAAGATTTSQPCLTTSRCRRGLCHGRRHHAPLFRGAGPPARLCATLSAPTLLVGYNSEHFDIPILNKYYPGDLTEIAQR
jgi:hypothetical protein